MLTIALLLLTGSVGNVPEKLGEASLKYFDDKAEYDAWNRLYLCHKLLRESFYLDTPDRIRVEKRALEHAKTVSYLYPGTAAAEKAEEFIAGNGEKPLSLDEAPPRPEMPDELKNLLSEIASLENQRWTLHKSAWRQYQKEIREERQRLLDRKAKRLIGRPGAARGEEIVGSGGTGEFSSGGTGVIGVSYAADIREMTTRLNFLYSTLNEGMNADVVWVRSKRNKDKVTPGYFRAK